MIHLSNLSESRRLAMPKAAPLRESRPLLVLRKSLGFSSERHAPLVNKANTDNLIGNLIDTSPASPMQLKKSRPFSRSITWNSESLGERTFI